MARSRVYRPEISCPECGSRWMRKNGFTNGRQAYRCGDCQRGYAPGGAYQRPGKVLKAPGIAIYLECGSLSSVRRILGYSTPAVLGWVKKGVSAVNWLRERSAQRTEGAAWREPAAVMAGTEMWTYRGVRRGEKRESWWIGTAVVEETAGRRGVDFEVGDRSANIFERLYARLPEVQQYCRDRYAAYAAWFAPDCPQAGKGGPVNWNEGLHSFLRQQAEPTGAADKRLHQEHRNAGLFGGVGRPADGGKTHYPCTLRIPGYGTGMPPQLHPL